MSEPTKTKWRIAGEEVVSCNCSWGCPCQFNALPTTGRCEATGAWQIQEGYFGNTRLDGLRFGVVAWWPGPIHEGNGVWLPIIDERATMDQREALDRSPQRAAWRDILGGLRLRLPQQARAAHCSDHVQRGS